MNLFTGVMAVIVAEVTLYGKVAGKSWRKRNMPGWAETFDLASRETLLPVVKRSFISSEKGLGHISGVNRVRRHYLQRPFRDQSLPPVHHLSDYGTFNEDEHACGEILSRACQSPSDCEGCLGLFTCDVLRGLCSFKSISRSTGNFYQSLQEDQEYDVNLS